MTRREYKEAHHKMTWANVYPWLVLLFIIALALWGSTCDVADILNGLM
jgi:hypothetical protein